MSHEIYEYELSSRDNPDNLHLILDNYDTYKTTKHLLANLRAVKTIDPNYLKTYNMPEKIAYYRENCENAIFTDKLSGPENLVGGTLVVCDRSDLTITAEQCPKFNNCLLKNCNNVVIHSKIAGELRMKNCKNCEFTGIINIINKVNNCKNCKFGVVHKALRDEIFDHDVLQLLEHDEIIDPDIANKYNIQHLDIECDDERTTISDYNTIDEVTVRISAYDRYNDYDPYNGGWTMFIRDCENLEIINIDADIIYDIRNCKNLRKINYLYPRLNETKNIIKNCPKLNMNPRI